MISSISIEFKWFSKRSIRLIDGTRKGTTTPGQSRLGSNGNKGISHIPESFRTGTIPPEAI